MSTCHFFHSGYCTPAHLHLCRSKACDHLSRSFCQAAVFLSFPEKLFVEGGGNLYHLILINHPALHWRTKGHFFFPSISRVANQVFREGKLESAPPAGKYFLYKDRHSCPPKA